MTHIWRCSFFHRFKTTRLPYIFLSFNIFLRDPFFDLQRKNWQSEGSFFVCSSKIYGFNLPLPTISIPIRSTIVFHKVLINPNGSVCRTDFVVVNVIAFWFSFYWMQFRQWFQRVSNSVFSSARFVFQCSISKKSRLFCSHQKCPVFTFSSPKTLFFSCCCLFFSYFTFFLSFLVFSFLSFFYRMH